MFKSKSLNFRSRRGLVIFMVVLLVCVLFAEGCQPLRKKFTRKKKKGKKEEVVAILAPIDYPEARQSPQDKYAHHYSLRTVWHNSLLQAVREYEHSHSSDKKMMSLLDQVIAQVTEMQKYVVPEKQSEMGVLLDKLLEAKDDLAKSPELRQMQSIYRTLDSVDKDFRRDFNTKDMEEFLIKL